LLTLLWLWIQRVGPTISLEVGFKSSRGDRIRGRLARTDDRRGGAARRHRHVYESIGLLPRPARLHGQRRYDSDVLGRLAFIGVAQSAGFKLSEIKDLLRGIDDKGDMAAQMRALSSRKLDEVQALLDRTNAMKNWLEVATECGCRTPEECTLFPLTDEQVIAPDFTLGVVQVGDGGCRRARHDESVSRA